MSDTSGGDYTFHVVDDVLWDQISNMQVDDMPGDDQEEKNMSWDEAVGWLVLPDIDQHDHPAWVPAPAGRVLAEHHTQAGVIERADFEGTIKGFLSLR